MDRNMESTLYVLFSSLGGKRLKNEFRRKGFLKGYQTLNRKSPNWKYCLIYKLKVFDKVIEIFTIRKIMKHWDIDLQ